MSTAVGKWHEWILFDTFILWPDFCIVEPTGLWSLKSDKPLRGQQCKDVVGVGRIVLPFFFLPCKCIVMRLTLSGRAKGIQWSSLQFNEFLKSLFFGPQQTPLTWYTWEDTQMLLCKKSPATSWQLHSPLNTLRKCSLWGDLFKFCWT